MAYAFHLERVAGKYPKVHFSMKESQEFDLTT